jgi:hypothetical protein
MLLMKRKTNKLYLLCMLSLLLISSACIHIYTSENDSDTHTPLTPLAPSTPLEPSTPPATTPSEDEPPTPSPVITSFTASPNSIVRGGPSVLVWSVTGADTVSIDNGVGIVSNDGSKKVSPPATTVYTLTATSGGGSVTATASIEVLESSAVGNPVIDYFTAQHLGGNLWKLEWSVSYATTAVIEPDIGPVEHTGNALVTVQGSKTFRLSTTNDWGWAWHDVTLYGP